MTKPEQVGALGYQQLVEENAELKKSLEILKQDQLAAYQMQHRLLPAKQTVLEGFRLDYLLQPALHLSGDFLDFWSPLPHKLFFYIADVSGSGSASALVTILLRYLLKKYTSQGELSPAALCTKVNEELLASGLEKHLTLVLGCLDTQSRELTYTLAAHLPVPLAISKDEVKELEGEGLPVGLFPGAVYKDYTCTFPKQGRLCLASDGVLEVLPGQGLQTRQVEWQQLVAATGGDVETLLQHLTNPLVGWPDDVTLMTLSGC